MDYGFGEEEQRQLVTSDKNSKYTEDDSFPTSSQPKSPQSSKQKWSNDTELLLALISMSVGIGNVWRFPYTAYENGGGAFLVPYLIVVTFISRPLYFFESCLGQFSGYSAVKVWNMVPLFRGIGLSQLIAISYILSYYTTLIGLATYYFFVSFQSELPWSSCKPNPIMKNTYVCVDLSSNVSIASAEALKEHILHNNQNNENISVISPAEEYLIYHVLKQKESIVNGIGSPDAVLTGCLVFVFVILFISMAKGTESTGKVAYLNAIFPYIVMITLMAKVFTLPGAWDGVKFLLVPKWEELLNLSVWFKALMQSFYSLTIGVGSLLNYTSSNHFRHNLYRYEITNYMN